MLVQHQDWVMTNPDVGEPAPESIIPSVNPVMPNYDQALLYLASAILILDLVIRIPASIVPS